MNFDNELLNLKSLSKKDSSLNSIHIGQSSYEIENFLKVMSAVSEGDPFKVLMDPTYTGFKLFFHFASQSGLLAAESNVNSALAYLKRIGQTQRYILLKQFIKVLSKVNSITPWMFQEINGLDEIWSKKRSDVKISDDSMIEISTLESLDGKMQSIIAMYREISYDYEREVYVLPINLRRFSMSIYVYDFRMFSTESPTAYAFLQTLENTDIKKLNHTLFDLGYCEFTEDSGKSYFSSVNNNATEEAKTNLSIKYEKVVVSSLFRSITGNMNLTASSFSLVKAGMTNTADIDLFSQEKIWIDRLQEQNIEIPSAQESSIKQQVIDTLKKSAESAKNSIKSTIKDAPSYLAEQSKEIAIDVATSKINRLFLGNIYGFNIADNINSVERIKDLRQAFESTKMYVDNERMKSLESLSQSNNLGNINS